MICLQQTNTMRYDCTVNLSGSATVRIGHQLASGGTWNWSGWAIGDPVVFPVYNLKPDAGHVVKAQVFGGPISELQTLGTPMLPTVSDSLSTSLTSTPLLKSSGSEKTNYVIFDVDAYIAIVDISGGYISWYQDVEEASGLSGVKLTGWSYTADKTILVGVDQGHVFEWALDGSEVHDVDLSATCGGASGDVDPARTTTRTAAPTTARPA